MATPCFQLANLSVVLTDDLHDCAELIAELLDLLIQLLAARLRVVLSARLLDRSCLPGAAAAAW